MLRAGVLFDFGFQAALGAMFGKKAA
jgi:hypothetical protein